MKLREKTTATLLIAIFMISAFAVAIPVSAQTIWVVEPEGYFDTIQEAIDASEVKAGDTILVVSGEWFGAVVTKAVEIKGEEGAIIVDGPILTRNLKQGFRVASDRVTISHFTFEVEFPVFAAASVDDVTVEHNTMYDPIQGVTNWYGSGWTIKHNVISGLWDFSGGGIGIFIGAGVGNPAKDNLVAFNKITCDFPEERDYLCTGICLITYGGEITGNKVVHNDVLITGFDTRAIDMTFSKWYTAGFNPEDVFHDNKIGFNDLRGSTVQIGCTIYDHDIGEYLPEDEARTLMESYNTISRNLGDNRAYDGIPADELKPT